MDLSSIFYIQKVLLDSPQSWKKEERSRTLIESWETMHTYLLLSLLVSHNQIYLRNATREYKS